MKKEKVEVCGKQYNVIRLLGHGKGGYSSLMLQRVVAGSNDCR